MNLSLLGNSYKWNRIIFVLLHLAYFTKHIFNVLYVVTYIKILFFTTLCSFISSIDRYLGCCHLLAVKDNAALNIGIQISVQVPAFHSFGRIPRNRIAGAYDSSVFWETAKLFSREAAPFYILISHAWEFLHILISTCYFLSFFFLNYTILVGMKWYLIVGFFFKSS